MQLETKTWTVEGMLKELNGRTLGNAYLWNEVGEELESTKVQNGTDGLGVLGRNRRTEELRNSRHKHERQCLTSDNREDCSGNDSECRKGEIGDHRIGSEGSHHPRLPTDHHTPYSIHSLHHPFVPHHHHLHHHLHLHLHHHRLSLHFPNPKASTSKRWQQSTADQAEETLHRRECSSSSTLSTGC